MREKIAELIRNACLDLYNLEVVVELERPEEQFGDFACNVAMQLSKPLSENPRKIAQEIVSKLDESPEIVEIGVAGPGFINITLSDQALLHSLRLKPSKYLSGMKILVEYSDPNPFKPLHAGHLYTTLVGDAISRLVENAGAETIRINYGGDVGLHVAKSMWAIINCLGGELPNKLKDVKEGDRAKWLGQRYVEGNNAYIDDDSSAQVIKDLNKRIYQIHSTHDKESEFAKIYWTCREWSYEFFKKLYRDLRVEPFDRFIAESEVTELGLATVREQLKHGVYKESDDAIIFDGEEHGLHTRVFVNSEGLPTYETKDVGLSLTKWKDYEYDESIIITANEQLQYMQVVIKSIELFASEPAQKTKHLTHGIVKLQGGEKMSSRLGNIVTADDILNAAYIAGKDNQAHDNDSTIISAVRYAFLKTRIGGDVVYDPEQSIAMEGNSGPYLQYAHARAKSVIRKSQVSDADFINTSNSDSLNLGRFERSLVRKLSEYPESVQIATQELAPHVICNYLYELAQNFNRFYENSTVIGDERENIRIYLVKKYSEILKDGLKLLGIEAPEKM